MTTRTKLSNYFSTISSSYTLQGVQGIQGPAGSGSGGEGSGSQGIQGVQGVQGQQGPIGFTGSQGVQGTQGTQGIQGQQGPIGFTGSQGIQGRQGLQGIQGEQGLMGFTGSQGLQGIQGIQGLIGIQGIAGPSTAINASDDTSATTHYPVFVAASGSNQTARVKTTSTALSYVPSTGTLSTTAFNTTGAVNAAGGIGIREGSSSANASAVLTYTTGHGNTTKTGILNTLNVDNSTGDLTADRASTALTSIAESSVQNSLAFTNTIRGVYGIARTSTTGGNTLDGEGLLYGGDFSVLHQSSDATYNRIEQARGVVGSIQTTGSTAYIDVAVGTYSTINPNNATSTINTGYLFFGVNGSGTGTYNNRWGVYISSPVNNYFSGGAQIGGSAVGSTSAAGLGVGTSPSGTAGSISMTGSLTGASSITMGSQSNKATIAYTTNTARTYTMPDAGADASFVMTEGTQTINGAKTFSNNVAMSANLDVSGDLTVADKIVHLNDTNTNIRFPAADTVTVETNGVERLRVDSSGNVGIGISNPLAKLDVYQPSAVVGLASARFGVNAGGGSPASLSGLTTYWNLSDGLAESSLVYGNSPYSFMTFGKHDGTSYSETMRINADGNVGIGTSDPTEKLHISGNIRVTGAYFDSTNSKGTAGQVLTSNSTHSYWAAVGAATNLVLTGSVTEDVDNTTYTAVTGTVALSAAAGTIQVWTLSGSVTSVTDSLSSGQYITLMIADGTAYTIAWGSTVTWVGGTAPTLATTGYTVIEIWKVGTVVYGAYIGAVA